MRIFKMLPLICTGPNRAFSCDTITFKGNEKLLLFIILVYKETVASVVILPNSIRRF